MGLTTIAKRNNPFRKFGNKFLRSKYLVLMIIPAIVFYAIFNYVPMYGILIAFKSFRPKLGIMRSPWNGIDNFVKVFEEEKFWLAFKNTLIIGSIKIVVGFLGAVIVALLLNELRMRRTKKVIQTIVDEVKLNENVIDCEYVAVNEITTSLANYYINVTCEPKYKLQVRRDALRTILEQFEKYNIKVPFTQLDIHQK